MVVCNDAPVRASQWKRAPEEILRHKIIPLAVLTLFAAAHSFAQTADKILSQHVSALGGARKIKPLARVEYRGEARAPGATEGGAFTLALQAPNQIYLEVAGGDHPWSEADNGKSAWRRDAQGLRTLGGPETRQLRAAGFFLNNRFLDYKKDKWSPAYLGAGEIGGHKTDVIEMSNNASDLAGVKIKFYFDSASHLLLKQETSGGASLTYDDYRAIDGVPEPFRLTLQQAGETLEIVVARVNHNPRLEARTFDYPGASLDTLPDMARLFADLSKHQGDMNDVRRNYSWILDQTNEEVDSKGKLLKTTNNRFYTFFLGNIRFRKLIAREGQPLGEEELRKEDEDIEHRKQEIEARRKQQRRDPAAKRQEEEADVVRDILKVMNFFNFRREPFHGREVLVFDFAAKPGYNTHGLQEALISKFIGTMWVDETDHEVARVQARTASALKVAAGLAGSLDSGSSLVVEQDKINGEIWLPVYQETHVAARILFKSVKSNQTNRYSDYKKFSVGSQVTFGPAK